MALDVVQTNFRGLGTGVSFFYFAATPGAGNEGQVWNGTAYEAWQDAHYSTYAVQASEVGTSGRYQASTPAGVLSAGPYAVVARKYSGTLGNDNVIGTGAPKPAIMEGVASGGRLDQFSVISPANSVTANALRTGTAQGGSSNTIILDSGASSIDGYYAGTVAITGGTGAGQDAAITSYTGSTRTITISGTWKTTPDNTSTFAVLPGAASGSGSGDLTITPIQASVTNPRFATQDLAPIAQNSTPTDYWVITDGQGNPINLSGKTVRFVAYTQARPEGDCNPADDVLSAVFKLETGGNGITVTGTNNNQVNVTFTTGNTASPANFRYWLLNVTDGIPLATGRLSIVPAIWNA